MVNAIGYRSHPNNCSGTAKTDPNFRKGQDEILDLSSVPSVCFVYFADSVHLGGASAYNLAGRQGLSPSLPWPSWPKYQEKSRQNPHQRAYAIERTPAPHLKTVANLKAMLGIHVCLDMWLTFHGSTCLLDINCTFSMSTIYPPVN